MLDRRLQGFLIGTIIVLICCFSLLHSRWLLDGFNQLLQPVSEQKARAVSARLASLIADMDGYGVPLDKLRGMEDIFSQIQQAHPDITYLSIQRKPDNVLYSKLIEEVGTHYFSVADHPVPGLAPDRKKVNLVTESLELTDGRQIEVVLGIDRQFQQKQQREILLDSLTVLVISMLIAIELLMFLYVFTFKAPFAMLNRQLQALEQGDLQRVYAFTGNDELGRIGSAINRIIVFFNQRFYQVKVLAKDTLTPSDATLKGREITYQFAKPERIGICYNDILSYVRPPLFLVIFAESMSLSFFPIFVESFYQANPSAWISKDLVISLPISIFMLIWALSLPIAGQWSDNHGRRRAFLWGALVTAVGLVLTAFSQNLWQLLFFRSLTAVGYAIVFITAQGYVTDLTTPENRTKGMATFLSSFFSGSLCGASIGGILADRIGYNTTFLLSALLAIVAALFAVRFFVDHAKPATTKVKTRLFSYADLRLLFSNKAFLVITCLSSIPAKAALTGIVYFTGPVYLAELGASRSDSGRILMSYGLAIILISPLAAWVVDKYKSPRGFIFLGGIFSCIALLSAAYFDNVLGVATAIAGLGLAHAFSVSPQSSLITATVPATSGLALGKTIGLYRLTERLGNISGPLLAAGLIALVGFQTTFLVFAVAILCLSTLFYFAVRNV